MAAPFFIIGTPRSGTTLLSVLLENHSRIYIDGESVGISLAREFLGYKRALAQNPTQSKADLLARLCKGSHKGRLARLINYQEAGEYPNIRTLLAASVNQFAARHGKEVWGDKTPELIFYLPELLELFPNARIIQVVRDARANVASLSQRQYYPLELAAQYWKEINGLGRAYHHILGESQYRMISYEDLLLRPESSLRNLCDFLGVPYENELTDLEGSEATTNENSYVGRRIDNSRINAWRTKLSERDALRIERICGDLMDDLGYKPEQLANPAEARSISYRRQFWLRQRMMWRMLFTRKRRQMIDRKLVTARIPLKQRLRNYFFGSLRQFFSEDFIRMFKSDYTR